MAHPVLWPKKSFFYPVGNTPPVCLTRELSPEESADILLLACGDPRSILYTVYADQAPKYREMDFTCCDWEPAILARNTLLLTMIVDGVSHHHAWSIFYNFFIDDKSYNVLLDQCRKLINALIDMQTWKKSKYGAHIKYCTVHTLTEVRRHLNLYLEHDRSSIKDKNTLKTSFLHSMKSVREKYGSSGSSRSAGPLALEFMKNASRGRDKFWSTGVIKSAPSQVTQNTHINPTFAYCRAGKTFNVHYGTNPLDCFFLAPAYTSIQTTETASVGSYEREVNTAVNQFSSWCSSFKERVLSTSSPKIVIRLFLGESLAFCHALSACRQGKLTKTGVHTFPWGNSQINFDPDEYNHNSVEAPLIYNVIETSNLADHAGLLNLLLVTVPLLRRGSSSVLYTDTLLSSKGNTASRLSSKTLADIPTISLFLGVAPVSHLSHFTALSNKHELLTVGATSPQFLEPLSWKYPLDSSSVIDLNSDDSLLKCEPGHLSRFLFGVYREMFSDEDWKNKFGNFGFETTSKLSIIHYIRASLAIFFAFVRARVQVDWTRVMDQFNDLVSNDRTLMMGANNYQDLTCQLYMYGLFDSLETFQPSFINRLSDPSGLFSGWKDIPPIVCIVLKVPRTRLKRLEAIEADVILTPILQCEVRTPQGHSIHSSIQPVFGDVEASYQSGELGIDINEDGMAWQGNSPLIVSFYMNSWMLLQYNPKSIIIGFHMRSTPSSVLLLTPILGMEMTIFSTDLTDKKHLYVVRHRPNNVGEVERYRKLSASNSVKSTQSSRTTSLVFNEAGEMVTHISVRETIKEPDAARSLSAGASVTSQAVSDLALQVSYTNFSKQFIYPFPIKVNQIKTRIARKSSYIEVEAPIRVDFEDTLDVSLNPFPVFFDKDKLTIMNPHYINIGLLPSLKFPVAPKSELQWLSVHLGMTMSTYEKERQRSPRLADHGAIVNLKESIGTIFLKYSGFDNSNERPRVYGLSNTTSGVGIWSLIFVNDIKLDLSSHTVVVDACVVPVYDGIMRKVEPLVQKLMKLTVQIITDDDETRLWKKLLPVLAERCRTWKHTSKCEYINNGVPVTLEGSNASLLCSCGKGKDLGAFGTLQEWKRLHSEATRIAICPFFTFSWSGETISSVMRNFNQQAVLNDSDNNDPTASFDISAASESTPRCANCKGAGNPTLQNCSSCKKVKYCSRSCQKAHWKIHKPRCTLS